MTKCIHERESTMSNIFFTSDTHFGHANILKYDVKTRSHFRDVNEHDETLIKNWNDLVGPDDTVYHLGDFALCENPNKYYQRLNGKIHLIKGNHDHRNVLREVRFHTVNDVLLLKGLNKEGLFLSHYPHYSWPTSGRGCIHLFGHVHENFRQVPGLTVTNTYNKNLNVGVNWHRMTPISLDQILKRLP